MENNIGTTGEASPPPSIGTPAQIRDLLGRNVVLLGWPLHCKGTKRKWGYLTAASMTPTYLKKLEGRNIGVALGAVSGGLVAVDIDDDQLVKPFLAANPSLEGTLRTHGARGEVFWLRMRGNYPAKTVKLLTHAGEEAGEWRAGKNTQSIIAGIHPKTGKPYQVVNMARPLEVDFASIVWPDAIANPPTLNSQLPITDTEEPDDTEDTEETDEVCVSEPACLGVSSVSSVSSWLFSVHSVEDALRVSTPSSEHQNYRCALILARAVKALEAQTGKPFTPDQHRDIHNEWLTRAAPFLRPGQSTEEYFMEYLNAYRLAKYPLGSMSVAQAIKAARENPLSPDALPWAENADLRLLVAVCRELQKIAGEEPFFLSARTVMRIFNQDTHATGAKWLRSLCVMEVLEEVKKGTGKRATRYLYKGPS